MTFNEATKKGIIKTKHGNYHFPNNTKHYYKETICYQCNEKHLQRSDNVKEINFCSINCRSKYFSGDKSQNWKGGKVKHECPMCKKIFYTCKAQADKVCCSWECAGTLQQLKKINGNRKYCSKCEAWKDFSCFGFSKSNLFNLSTRCRECENKRGIIYNKTEGAKKSKIRYAQSDNGKYKLVEYINSERHTKRLKKYRATDKYKEIRRKSSVKARSNITEKLNDSLRRAINHCLHGKKGINGCENILGYTINDLMVHLEKQFVDGMSWDNYGKKGWVIDHSVPLSWFNFVTIKDQGFKDAWTLSNLQPMWDIENISKRNRYSGQFRGFKYEKGIN
jgi:hypothetical protein